jgi:Pvc16 N-terminal domain
LGTFQAIAATGQAMLGLLSDACPRNEFPTAQFELYQLSNFQQSPMEEGVSLYLYRIAPNTSRRNLPPTVGPDGRRYRPPIPLDLYYVASAWAPTAVKQQRLLGWAIRTFEDVPILPTGLLNNYGPESMIFQPDETVEIILDSLTLQDWNNLWSTTKNSPPLSVGYIARMLHIESSMAMSELPEVQTREFGLGKSK